MQKVVHNNILDESLDIVAAGIQFDHAFINWPRHIGQYPACSTSQDYYGMISSTLDLLNTQMKAGGMATIYYGGDASLAFAQWQQANPGIFEIVDNFQVYTGIEIHERKTLSITRREDSYFKTIKRVGDTVTKNDWVWDSAHQPDYDPAGMTLNSSRQWPYEGPVGDEAYPDQAWRNRNNQDKDTALTAFPYKLIEYRDDDSRLDNRSFIASPTNPWFNADQNGELTPPQKCLWINAHASSDDQKHRAIRHCVAISGGGGNPGRTKMVGWNYWWMKNYTAPGDVVFIPFCNEGDAILAALLAQRNFYAIDANIHRATICKDILLEYTRLLPNGS
jgi:hypothetical protein